ncbi:MAG: two-component system response regulator [Denitrovibrio sp.]|nr:MAG: two-component system response regulator [Denitrovibrio sp.]
MSDITVLIVEDDIKISEIHKMFVQKVEGFSLCGIANSISDAEKMIDILQPDLLLLDLYFPEGSGMELLREIRASSKSLDVILITAAQEMKALQDALHGGVYDYIVKPVIFERFEESLLQYKSHQQKIINSDSFDQKDIDGYFRSQKSTVDYADNIPKGIDPITLKKLKKRLKEAELNGMSAEEVGELVGTSRSTARRYLEYLISIDYLYADQVYGTVGRPERKYFMK